MEKHFRHLSYRPSKLSNRFQGNLAFTVLCLITLGSGIAMLSLKHYQYKRYWQRIHRNYYEEKQALEFCFAAFKQLKKAVTKDTVITYESNGKLYFRDTITKEDLVDLDEIFFEDSVKISIFSNSDTKQYISCLSKKEGMRQSLEDLFKKAKPPEELKEKEPFKDSYSLIRDRWLFFKSLRDKTSLSTRFFEPYLKAWDKSGNQLTLTFLNPFDKDLKGKYDLTLTVSSGTDVITQISTFNCSLNHGKSVSYTIKTNLIFSKFTLQYGKISIEKILKAAIATKFASSSKWRRPVVDPAPSGSATIVNNECFKTNTPLQCLNACLFFHKTLEPTVAFGKKDKINKYFWNNFIFDRSTTYFNLNANEAQLKQQLEGLFEEAVAELLCKDILEKQPFYDVYSFTSGLSHDVANRWNKLDQVPNFVVREESFIIETQLKNPQKKTSIQCRLWVRRTAKSDKEREWVMDHIEYKRL